jgi:cardiolipin synthase
MILANFLTFARLFLVPFFIYFFIEDYYLTAFVIFAVAGFTDLIDGTVARLFKQTSQIGALVDPLADKFLMLSTFACLAHEGVVPLWFFMLLIVRDIMIMGGIAFLRFLKIDVAYKALWTSKFATLFQLVTALLGLASIVWTSTYWFGWPLDFYMWGFMLLTTVLIVISGIQYVVIGFGILWGKEHGQA